MMRMAVIILVVLAIGSFYVYLDPGAAPQIQRGFRRIVATTRTSLEGLRRLIKPADEGFDHVAEYIAQFEEVHSLYLMRGGADLCVVVQGQDFRDIARFVAALSPDIPWHVSRFHPQYQRRETPPTPSAAVLRALAIGRAEGLRHVYCGNMQDDKGESTHCHGCGALLVGRSGYTVTHNALAADPAGTCPRCGVRCAGVWVGRAPKSGASREFGGYA